MVVNRAQRIEAELTGLPVGKTRMIAWECVTRWSETTWEVGTWGKKTTDLVDTLRALRA